MNIFSKNLLRKKSTIFADWAEYELSGTVNSCSYISFLQTYLITMSNGYIATTTNLINFDTKQIDTSTSWKCAACDNDTIILCGSGGKIAITNDLTNFTIKTVPMDTMNEIAYGNGKFVVCGMNSLIPCISYTVDKGSNFSPVVQVDNRTGYGVYQLQSISFGNNIFFAVPNDLNYGFFANSENIENWTSTVSLSITGAGHPVRFLPANNFFNIPANSGSMSGIQQNAGGRFWSSFQSIGVYNRVTDIAYFQKYYITGVNSSNQGVVLSGDTLDDRYISADYQGTITPFKITTGLKGILAIGYDTNQTSSTATHILTKRIIS